MATVKRRRITTSVDETQDSGKSGERWLRVLTYPERIEIGNIYGPGRDGWKAWVGGQWVGEFHTKVEAMSAVLSAAKQAVAAAESR